MSVTKTKQRKKKRKKMKQQQVETKLNIKPIVESRNSYELKSFSYTICR